MDKRKLNKKIYVFILSVICFIFIGCGKENSEVIEIKDLPQDLYEEQTDDKDSQEKENQGENKHIQKDGEYVYVHVCGAVKSPGVYKLKIPARVYEALESAGGITDDGCEDFINQAREIVDGEQIYIPTIEEKEEGSFTLNVKEEHSEKSDGIININTASEDELMTLPGIGQSKAKSIVDYRNDKGKFNSTEEIKNIEGIKDGVYNKIKDKISI